MRQGSREYEKPQVLDYGDLLTLTAMQGVQGSEDGVGKTIQGGVGGTGTVSVGILG